MEVLYDQIKQEFQTENLTDGTLKKFAQFCEVYSITPSELNDKWEAFIITKNDTTITEALIEEFQINELQKDLKYEEKRNINPFSSQSNNIKIDSEKVYTKDTINNLDSIFSGMGKNMKKIVPKNSNMNNTFSSPVRNSQNNLNIYSPVRSNGINGLFSPTRYGKIDKKDEISSMTQKFLDRPKKGELDFVLNKQLQKPIIDSDLSKGVSIELLNEDQQIESYRYMFTKLQDISEIINERIDAISELIKNHNKDIEHFAYPNQSLQEEFVTTGRLCSDILDVLDADNSKNNENAFILESSQRIGNGTRLRLNFAKLASEGKPYTLFPGQIIGIKGTNVTGKRIDVTDIIEPPPLPVPASSLSELSQYYGSDKKQPMSVFVASGPYTCEDSLQFEPFNELFEKYIEPEKPDVLILMGPFIDDRHPKIVNGETELIPEDIFKNYIAPKITEFYNNSKHSTIILIPSTNDILSETVSFPQPPLDSPLISRNEQFKMYTDESLAKAKSDYIIGKRMELGLPIDTRVICYPNPVQFQINDIIFAVSNNDILSHMSNEEVYHQASTFGSPSPFKSNNAPHRPMDRISRLIRHLFQQRSLYPLFPPAMDEANINYEHSDGYHLNIKPDVLILNSAMRLFAKTVDDVVCVNPGQVVHKVAGTFSKFYIYPMDLPNPVKIEDSEELASKVKKEEGEGGDDMEIDSDSKFKDINYIHEVSKRCRVEIQRV